MATKAATRSAANGKNRTTTAAKPKATVSVDESKLTPEQQADRLAKRLRAAISKHFGVAIPMRDERASLKVGHAIRELVGLDINAKLQKSNQRLDWNKYNKFFAAMFGEPDALKYDPEVIAVMASKIYEWISANPDEGVAQLVEYNRESLKRRNERQKAEEEEFDVDDLGDEIDDIEDQDEESDDDELEATDETEESDDDEFDDEFGEDE